MAATVVSGSKDRQIPGIDGGTFTTSNPLPTGTPGGYLIRSRLHRVHTLLLQRTASAGESIAAVSEPTYFIFNTASSSGAFVPNTSTNLLAGENYSWLAWGIGG